MILATNPVLQTAHDFWCALPRAADIPDICQLDAAVIPRALLPHLIVAETTRANFDLSRLRLCGSEVSRWFRELPEGMDAKAYGGLTDAFYTNQLRDLLAELIQRRTPVYCRSIYTLPPLTPDAPENIVTAERLALPLSNGDRAVGCVIVAATLKASDSRAGPIRMLPPEPGTAVRHDPFVVV